MGQTAASRILRRFAVRSRSAAFLAIVLLTAWPGASHAEEPVEVEATAGDGYGRLVLTFPERLPEFEMRTTPGVVVISFDRPLTLDPGLIASRLPDYVTAARRDPDGRALRLALAQPATMNAMEAGDQLYLDLLPQNWRGHPPALPQSVIDELVRRAEEAERHSEERKRRAKLENAGPVGLRLASLPTFTRFVFQWDEPVAARIERRLDRVRVVFEDFGKLETAGLLTQLPGYVGHVSAENGPEGLEVELIIDPESGVRGFQEELSYVVDVSMPAQDLSANQPELPELSRAARQLAQLQGAASEPQPEESETAQTAPVRTRILPLPEMAVAPRQEEPDAAPSPASETAPREGTAPMEGRPGEARPGSGKAMNMQPVRVEARRFGDGARIVFPFSEETSAAVFENGGALWLVFDSAQTLDLRGLEHDLIGLVSDVELMAEGDRKALRLVLKRPHLTSVETARSSWVVHLGDSVLERPTPLRLERAIDENGSRSVTIELPDARELHELHDPESGQALSVVTAPAPARGLTKSHNFVDFSARASLHGVAIRRHSDDVAVRLEDGLVRVLRPQGLAISMGVPEDRRARGPRLETAVRPGFVDIGADGVVDAGAVYSLISGYVSAVAEAEEDERAMARLRLAETLLATGLGAEALGQLRLLTRDEPSAMRRPAVRALKGVALTLAHRPKEALAEFDEPRLDDSSDVALWRGLAKAQLGHWREAEASLSRGMPALASYSQERQRMFGLAAAQAALELGETSTAAVRLAQLDDLLSPHDAELALLDGRLAEALGNRQEAVKAYALARENGEAGTVAEARLRQALLRQRAGEIDLAAAIDELETLSVVWRGDETELRTLRHLAGLHVEAGNHRRSFELMKSATILDSESPVTRALQDDMNRAFAALFLEGGADELPPIEALALYYDFRELTPIGSQGDEIIRWLADRLIAVDLLDQAAELLTHQVEHRLSGAVRAQVAARLAMVHLMNRAPHRALTVIARTRQAVLPQEIVRQRALIEARALSETGRADMALDLLAGLNASHEVERLNADTLWRAERWQEAGEAYERLLGDKWYAGGGLSGQDQADVLRAAVALALAEDRHGLERLRARFVDKMAESERAGAFEAVSDSRMARAGEFRALVREVAGLDTLDAFLREYRARYDRPFEHGNSAQS